MGTTSDSEARFLKVPVGPRLKAVLEVAYGAGRSVLLPVQMPVVLPSADLQGQVPLHRRARAVRGDQEEDRAIHQA